MTKGHTLCPIPCLLVSRPPQTLLQHLQCVLTSRSPQPSRFCGPFFRNSTDSPNWNLFICVTLPWPSFHALLCVLFPAGEWPATSGTAWRRSNPASKPQGTSLSFQPDRRKSRGLWLASETLSVIGQSACCVYVCLSVASHPPPPCMLLC